MNRPLVAHRPARCVVNGRCSCLADARPECAGLVAGRRQALGLFTSFFLAPMAQAQVASDLLDPAVLQRQAGNHAGPDEKVPLAALAGPGVGLSMAESVAASLDALTAAAASRVTELDRLTKLIDDTQSLLQRAITLMAETMDDYRSGLFCSGCGKTKTEILKVGDTFPHPGQEIVRPTQEQIDAKEREMQAPIDRAKRELQGLQARRRKAAAERDEALSQIDAGLALWNTSLAFERQSTEHRLQVADLAYQADRAALDNAMAGLSGTAPAVQQERDKLRDARVTLERRRRAVRADGAAAQARAADRAAEHQQRIEQFLARNPLPRVLSATATITAYVHPTASFNALGGLYRMGDFNVANIGEPLPRVETFIAAFRRLPTMPTVPEPDATAKQKLRDLLKELLACEPDDAKCNARPPNGGSGVRG
jgi:hypothetical protein